jgi:hypothetical protein
MLPCRFRIAALSVAAVLILACSPAVHAQQDDSSPHDAEGNVISSKAADPAQMRAVMLAAATQVIAPGYARFHAAGEKLVGATESLCAAPHEARLASARSAFTETALAWGHVENIRFGPVMSDNRLERVLFWPDRKGIGLKQVQGLLAKKDETALDPETLASKSVAVQGLGALEFALFGARSDKLARESGYRCSFALAVSRNLAAIGGELARAWKKPEVVLSVWLSDDDPNATTEMLNELVGALVHGLEATRDIRLRGFMGDTPEKDRPRVALFRRSGNTVPMIAADIEGLRDLFVGSGMETLLPDDVGSIGDSIRFEFGELIDVAGNIRKPIAEAVADPDERQRLALLDIVMDSLIERFDTQYAPATGLTSGFSFSDGD